MKTFIYKGIICDDAGYQSYPPEFVTGYLFVVDEIPYIMTESGIVKRISPNGIAVSPMVYDATGTLLFSGDIVKYNNSYFLMYYSREGSCFFWKDITKNSQHHSYHLGFTVRAETEKVLSRSVFHSTEAEHHKYINSKEVISTDGIYFNHL